MVEFTVASISLFIWAGLVYCHLQDRDPFMGIIMLTLSWAIVVGLVLALV